MTTASKITMVRIAFIPLFMTFMYLSWGQSNIWMWLGLAVFILASITDFLDGYIARHYHQVSDFGKFLDPLADKLLVISAMVMFCCWGKMPGWALMLVLTREFAVTGLRLVAVGKGKVIAAGWSGKVKTACTMVVLCLWMIFPEGHSTLRDAFVNNQVADNMKDVIVQSIAIFVTVVISTLSGIEYFVKNWKCLWDD